MTEQENLHLLELLKEMQNTNREALALIARLQKDFNDAARVAQAVTVHNSKLKETMSQMRQDIETLQRAVGPTH